MTAKRLSPKEAETIKKQLAAIITDHFDNNGQLITEIELAREHVRKNASLSAAFDVQQYGGVAITYLRSEFNYAIIPVTASVYAFASAMASPATVPAKLIADTVAGLGAGGTRLGWYQPTGIDDPLWIAYNGHLGKSGARAIYHAGIVMDGNKGLLSGAGLAKVAQKVTETLPIPPGNSEKVMLEADSTR